MATMMSMQELFYGQQQNEPASYFSHFARQPGPCSVADYYSQAVSATLSFHLMVPMCCAQCADQVRGALFAVPGVRDVVCDSSNQRVTVTGSGVDPAQVLKLVRRVQSGAKFWSDSRRYVASSYQKPRRSARSGSASSSSSYTRSFCPAYRDTAQTYYIDRESTATVEESEY